MRRVLHFGAVHGGPMLCGEPWDAEAVTWRPYELGSDANKRWVYLADTEPCPRCHRILNDRGEFDVKVSDHREARIAFLERKLAATRADLLMKYEDDDFHGVADAAMDLRDILSELKGLRL